MATFRSLALRRAGILLTLLCLAASLATARPTVLIIGHNHGDQLTFWKLPQRLSVTTFLA